MGRNKGKTSEFYYLLNASGNAGKLSIWVKEYEEDSLLYV